MANSVNGRRQFTGLALARGDQPRDALQFLEGHRYTISQSPGICDVREEDRCSLTAPASRMDEGSASLAPQEAPRGLARDPVRLSSRWQRDTPDRVIQAELMQMR
jgi:hypothetical protein